MIRSRDAPSARALKILDLDRPSFRWVWLVRSRSWNDGWRGNRRLGLLPSLREGRDPASLLGADGASGRSSRPAPSPEAKAAPTLLRDRNSDVSSPVQ